jgi:putative endonuclease
MRTTGGWVYMMTNRPAGVLYIGVTSDLVRRASEHRTGEVAGFTQRYGLKRLVYFERHEDICDAIAREKALKKWRRAWKDELIATASPAWDDLYEGIL